MKMPIRLGSLALALSLAALAGCNMDNSSMGGMHAKMWANVNHAVAVLEPTQGNSVSGTIKFAQEGNDVHITGDIKGLSPNSTHAFHIHEFGDETGTDGTAAGGHYNPEGYPHGSPMGEENMHHAGDLGNITADASGTAHVDETVNFISVAGMKNPIIGRSVVVHAGADDMKTQPTGAAGARIAVGTIGIAK